MLIGENCIRCLLKIIYACDKEVVIIGTPKSSPSVSGGNSYLLKTLKEVLYHIIADTVSIMITEVRPIIVVTSMSGNRWFKNSCYSAITFGLSTCQQYNERIAVPGEDWCLSSL